MKSQSEELLSCEPALNIGPEWNVAVEVLFGFDCCFDFTHTYKKYTVLILLLHHLMICTSQFKC